VTAHCVETATPLDFTFPGVPLHGSYSYKKKKGAKVAPPTMPESEGGFDAIVGNPPYRICCSRTTPTPETLAYLRSPLRCG